MSIVELVGLTKDYGATRAVEQLTVNVEQGEFLTFLGPSGCGKTTSLRLVAGFIEPTEGRIIINGRTMSDASRRIQVPPEERNLGMVFQSYAVWPHMTVFDNVAYPLRITHQPRRSIPERVERALELVQMSDLAHRRPHELSGGQQQRVALARALVTTPDVLLLDEPLSNLDAKLREEMRIEIKELQRRTGVTIIFVTHDQLEAMVMSDRIVVMHRGRIRQIGRPEEIYRSPADRFVADFIGTANFVEVGDGNDADRPANDSGGPAERDVLVVRPEDIEICKDIDSDSRGAGPSEGGRLKGEVGNRLFLGDAVLYLVRVGEKTFRVKTKVTEEIKPGDRVCLDLKRVYRFRAGADPTATASVDGAAPDEARMPDPADGSLPDTGRSPT